MTEYSFSNEVPREDFSMGIVVAENLSQNDNEKLDQAIAKLVEYRSNPLDEKDSMMKKGGRTILRNGKYKPSGRSKPASEYLLRAATEKKFPRIFPAVDIINYISLKFMVAISVWDTDKKQKHDYLFRLGREEERYIFNAGGQEIKLEDLISGFVIEKGQQIPIVNPVKDSLATKMTENTRNIAIAVYCPSGEQYFSWEEIEQQLLYFIQPMAKSCCSGSIKTSEKIILSCQ